MQYSSKILHWINDRETPASGGRFFSKKNPATGRTLAEVTRGKSADVNKALRSAQKAFSVWSGTPVIKRAEILRTAVLQIQKRKNELAAIVALESGKSKKSSLAEVEAAIECGFFFAGDGRRYGGEVLPSAMSNRRVFMIRQPVGIGALITPFNNPASGIAWKLFPALLCGNAVVIKSHEHTPYTAIWFANIFKEVGLPTGVISVLQGLGSEVGAALVREKKVQFVSFTGSVKTGQSILKSTSDRLVKVSIEAGGKNPFVVCDDADLEKAVFWAVTSAFVDGGQRCAAASRIIIFDKVYEKFKSLFLEKVKKLKIGIKDTDDYGAIISEERMETILQAVEDAKKRGAGVLAAGRRLSGKGYFMAPTVLENISPKDFLSVSELFGPVVILYKVKNLKEAIKLANDSELKLTGVIHTKSMDRAQAFVDQYESGVVRVNGPTHGSEPHMPFGGLGLSGNGWREPGTKALDFYSEWKQVSIDYSPDFA